MSDFYTVEVAHEELPAAVLLQIAASHPATAAMQAAQDALCMLVEDDDLPDEDDTDALELALADQEHTLAILCDASMCRVWAGRHDTTPTIAPVWQTETDLS